MHFHECTLARLEQEMAKAGGPIPAVEKELERRYKKIRQIMETHDLMDLTISGLRRMLNETCMEMSRLTEYNETYTLLDIRATALYYLLVRDQLASVSASPSKE